MIISEHRERSIAIMPTLKKKTTPLACIKEKEAAVVSYLKSSLPIEASRSQELDLKP